jgi:hypothetical protein
MLAREIGDWAQVSKLGRELNLSLSYMAGIYNQAMLWAHQATTIMRPGQRQ